MCPASCSLKNWDRRTWSSDSFNGDSASAASIVSIGDEGGTWKSVWVRHFGMRGCCGRGGDVDDDDATRDDMLAWDWDAG